MHHGEVGVILPDQGLFHRTGDKLMPAFLIVAAAAVSLIAMLFLREGSRSTLAVTAA